MKKLPEEPTFPYEVFRSAICIPPIEMVEKKEVCSLQVNAFID